jgi:alpha-1,2-mannosyltransferase
VSRRNTHHVTKAWDCRDRDHLADESRPEKDHAKQLHAFAKLYEEHPEHRTGETKITLTMMGGARDAADQARLEGLKALAYELGIEVSSEQSHLGERGCREQEAVLMLDQQNVEFLVNAPYAEIVRRLGEASVGLNTMQDEHFGINVVEFMVCHGTSDAGVSVKIVADGVRPPG